MLILCFLRPGLIWATKCRLSDTETHAKSKVSNVPQINPNGIVLDYANLPKIEDVIEELKTKAEAELSPDMAAKFFSDLHSPSEKAEMLLQLPEWKPASARILSLRLLPQFSWTQKDAFSLLYKAIEQGDFQLLKDLIDYSQTYSSFFSQYLDKYGLMHAKHLPQDMRDAFEEWRTCVGEKSANSLLIDVSATLFSDYSKNHRSMLRKFNPYYTRSPVDIKLQFVFLHANIGKEAIMRKIRISESFRNFKNLTMLEKLCLEYKVPDYEAGLQKIGGPTWTLFKASQVTSEMLEQAFSVHSWLANLDELRGNVSKVAPLIDVFYTAFQKNWEWFEAKFPSMPIAFKLLFAFSYPKVMESVALTLPDEMPPIEQIINPMFAWSFEKAEYFKVIVLKYKAVNISQAMQTCQNYSADAYFHLAIISNPSIVINPQKYEHLRPTDLSDEEKVAWWSFFTHRTEPVPLNSSGKLRWFGMPLKEKDPQ